MILQVGLGISEAWSKKNTRARTFADNAFQMWKSQLDIIDNDLIIVQIVELARLASLGKPQAVQSQHCI